ncbi:MAG: ChaB family protein [Alphaproteobacteria bacterium]|nr:ChaB family protein [Alphaproteobacteria bacterium]
MPYSTNSELPAPVRHHLPQGAQTIYREAFNGAWHQYAESGRREEICHRVAWAAVKKRYRKDGEMWVPLTPSAPGRPGRVRRG